MRSVVEVKKVNRNNANRFNLFSFAMKLLIPVIVVLMSLTQLFVPFNVTAEKEQSQLLKQLSDGTYTIETWADLEKLGTQQGNAYEISGNYTIKIKEDLVATSPIIITGNVNISGDSSNKTIYREKGNTDFTVFTVNNGGTLKLGNNVTMTGEIASEYSKVYTLTVMDGAGNPIYKKHVFPNNTSTVDELLSSARIYVSLPNKDVIFEEDATGTQRTDWDAANWSLNNENTRTTAFNYLFENKPDSPYKKGFAFDGWDFGNVDKTKTMAQIDGDVTVVAKWKGHYLFKVTDGFGNIIYQETLNEGETRSCEQIMRDAGLIDASSRDSILKAALQGKNGPYKDGYAFDDRELDDQGRDNNYGWNYGEVVPSRPHNQLTPKPSSVTVIAKWKEPERDYKLIVTDGYGNIVYQNNNADKTKTVNELMSSATVGNLTTDSGRTSAFNNTIKNNSASPYYENNGVIEYDFVSWNYGNDVNGNAINGNTTMSTVGGDLTVGATWKKKYSFTVTDGYGNVIYQKNNISIYDNSTVRTLMENATVGNLLNETSRNAALANTLAGKVSPQNSNYTFTGWNYGKDSNGSDIGESTTMSSLGGNLTVCATWEAPSGIEYSWTVPEVKEGTPMQIGIGDKFVDYSTSGSGYITHFTENLGEASTWVMTDVQPNGSFRLRNSENSSLYLIIRYQSSGQANFNHEVLVGGSGFLNHPYYVDFFQFEIDENDNAYLIADSSKFIPGYEGTKKYLIREAPGIDKIWFNKNKPNDNVTPYVGQAVEVTEFENPDTPGYSEVDNFGGTLNPVGYSEASSKVQPSGGYDLNNPTDSPGKQQPYGCIEGEKPNTDTAGKKAVDPSSGVYNKIDPSTIADARYTRGGAENTQIFDNDGEGFFVQVNNGGTLNIEGANLQDLKTGLLNNQGVMVQDTSVENSAPVVVDGGTMHFTSGSIQNNSVGYTANDALSGKQVTGVNSEGWGVRDYLNRQTPTKTAGGIIFTNGAVGVITGESYIKQNQGDTGGIMVNGKDTDVTIGGSLNYIETNVPYTVIATDGSTYDSSDYYVLGTDDHFHPANQLPAGVTSKDNKTYKPEISSSVGGGHIDQNVGFHYAGAALVENGATLRMVGSNSTMNNNVTWNRGGAVWATEFGTGGDGKGVQKGEGKHLLYDQNNVPVNKQPHGEGTFIMTNGEIDGNTAFVRGGGINVESNRVFLIGGTISDNYSRSLGGGIYVEGDYADYNYTLVLNRGYIGTNYSVRYWESLSDTVTSVDDGNGNSGHYNGYTLSQMNDILDRKLGHPDANGNPLAVDANGIPVITGDGVEIAKGNGYPNRTADVRDYKNPHEGNGGGIWLCPIGGTAVFHMNADNEVIIDDNYASGNTASDSTRGTDLYLHSGTGHMLVQNQLGENGTFEIWKNEKTGEQIPENGPVYSGPLYLVNDTANNTAYGNTTYGERKAVEKHQGVHIVNNVSRNGGGIGADGTLLFGLPNDVYKHDAELDFYKYWPEENAATKPVRFKMFYLDENGNEVELPGYAFGLDGSNSSSNDYDFSPETGSSNTPNADNYIVWRSKVTIPVSVDISDTERPGFNKSYPMYKLQYTGDTFTYTITNSATESTITVTEDEIIDPSTTEGMKKLYAISERDKKNNTYTQLKIVDWKLVIKEYDEDGNELANAEFKKISSRTVTVSNDNSIPIDVIDAGGVGKKIKGYNMNFSSAEFIAEVKNSNGPIIEKYISNKVHKNLTTFDQVFEYEIMAYVPLDADEVIIYDTLENPLMFVSSVGKNPQYLNTDNTINSAFANEFNNANGKKFFIINNNDSNKPRLAIYDSNNHLGDGTGTVSTNDGTPFTSQMSNVDYDKTTNPNEYNPMNAGNVTIGNITANDLDSNGNVKSITESVNGNTLFIKIDNTSGIEAVRGKYVRVIFDAAIKPAYRDLEKLKEVGWLNDDDLKTGSPVYYEQSVKFEGAGWEELNGIEEIIGKQFITKVARGGANTTHVFAQDEFGDCYAKKKSDGIWKRLSEDGPNPENIATAQNRLAGGNGFQALDLNKKIEYKHYDAQFVSGATYTNGGAKVTTPVTPVAGAYGSGDWMFVKDSDGNYWVSNKNDYFVKSGNTYLTTNGHFVLKNGVKSTDVTWRKLSDNSNPTKSFAHEKIYNDASSTPMDILEHNWPIMDEEGHVSQQPHQGESNQAHMVIDHKNTYNSNIVTVDVLQPEKYVNDKVHEILRHDQAAEGAFDQVFEYEIMAYVPDDADEFVIWDTLREDLMFVDRHGKTQYKTYTIGTNENNNFNNLRDILNTEFMTKTDDDNVIANDENNLGVTLVANDGKSIDPENDRNNHQLQVYDDNNHKGDGTGTVSTAGTDVNGPIATTGYIGLVKEGNIPSNWDTLPTNDKEGNTIFIKMDQTTGIENVRGKWVKVTFFAQIKPTKYFDIVDKLQKSSRHTNDKTQAVDYDAVKNPNPTPVGYNYRTTQYTTLKMNAMGYNPNTDTVPNTSIHGYYTKNASTGYFTEFTTTKPTTGTEGQDWITEYSSAYVFHASSLNDIPTEVKTNNDYEAVYLKKGWNEKEDANNDGIDDHVVAWEKVTDDGYVKDGINLHRNNTTKEAYLDVQADGSHAGLANSGRYAVKIGNDWNSVSTNTVTVVPLLRTITVSKVWNVAIGDPIPSAHELLEHLHLYWERITNLDATAASDHGETVGEITDLYKQNITIVEEREEEVSGIYRYTWIIEVKDLPQLRPSMKYFLLEDQIDGFDRPRFINPADPEATEHAHDTGTIINSKETGHTEVLVRKEWDIGGKSEMDGVANETIQVQLFANGNPVYQRDSSQRIILDTNGDPIVDPNSIRTIDSNLPESWYTLFYPLPKYERNNDGTYKTEYHDKDGNVVTDVAQALKGSDDNPIEFKIPIEYSVKILTDPEGYILTSVTKKEHFHDSAITDNILEAADLHQFVIGEGGVPVDGYINGTYNRATVAQIKVTTNEVVKLPSEDLVFSKIGEDIITSGALIDEVNSDLGEFIKICNPSAMASELSSTGDIEGRRFNEYACYYYANPDYYEYEINLVNTKPQIEKYINDDVHYETLMGSELFYDIMVYVPAEATEIEIVDELLPTLQFRSIEQPTVSGGDSREITGYTSVYPTTSGVDVTLAVHEENNHKIYGTENSDTVSDTAKGTAVLDGNGFKIHIENIVPVGNPQYVPYELGEYVKVIDSNGNDAYVKASEVYNYEPVTGVNPNSDEAKNYYVKVAKINPQEEQYVKYYDYLIDNVNANNPRFEWHKQYEDISEPITFYKLTTMNRADDNFYRKKNEQYYVESAGGNYKKYVSSWDPYNFYYADQDAIPEGGYEASTTKYNLVDSNDQAIGGRYVQVTFKAQMDTSKRVQLKEWIDGGRSLTNGNKDLDWDVITTTTNKAWDDGIKTALSNNNLSTSAEYIPANTANTYSVASLNKLNDYLNDNNLEIDKLIKNINPNNKDTIRYEAKDKSGNYYIQFVKPTTLAGKWFKLYVDNNVTKYEDVETGDIYLQSEIQEINKLSGDWSAYGHVKGNVDNGTNLLRNTNAIPVTNELYYKEIADSQDKYYLDWIVDNYADTDKQTTIKANGSYLKVDWGRGDGDVIRQYPNNFAGQQYEGDHAGIVNTASYEVTYGNGYKSSHKSNTVTVKPLIYELPSSGGIGTYIHTILGTLFVSLSFFYFLRRKKMKESGV